MARSTGYIDGASTRDQSHSASTAAYDLIRRVTHPLLGVLHRLLAKDNLPIASIIVLAALLRFLALSTNPAGVYYDELFQFASAWGQATGNGIYASQPVAPLATASRLLYLEYPSLEVLGNTTIAIRLPGALYGTALVVPTYLLASRLFSRKVALLSSLFVAIDPMAIQASRNFDGASSIVPAFYLTCAVWLFISARSDAGPMRFRLYASYFLFALPISSIFSVYGRLTSALVLVFLLAQTGLAYRRKWKQRDLDNLLIYAPTVVLSVLFLIPLLLNAATGNPSSATGQLSFFLQSNLLLDGPQFWPLFLSRYLTYFSPGFVLWNGDHASPTGLIGALLPSTGLLIYIGMISVAVGALRKRLKSEVLLLLVWFLSVPVEVAAYSTINYVDWYSVIFFVPPIEIFASWSFFEMIDIGRRRRVTLAQGDTPDESSGMRARQLAFGRPRPWASVGLAIVSLVLAGFFALGYFSSGMTAPANDPTDPFGSMYGFPQVASFIDGHGLSQLPLYFSPDGIAFMGNGTNSTLFNYWFYYTRTPLNYLNYYSNGQIRQLTPIDVRSFYSPTTSLVLTGSLSDFRIMSSAGLRVSDVYSVNRPDGALAMTLIEVFPGLQNWSINQLYQSEVAHLSNASKREVFNFPVPLSLGESFTISVNATIPANPQPPTPGFNIVSAVNGSFSIGAWYFHVLDAPQAVPPNTVVPESTIYTMEGNYSTTSGSWVRVWSPPYLNLSNGGTIRISLAFYNESVRLYLGPELVGIGVVSYPIQPSLSGVVLGDSAFPIDVNDVEFWTPSLTSAQIAYYCSAT